MKAIVRQDGAYVPIEGNLLAKGGKRIAEKDENRKPKVSNLSQEKHVSDK
jgi:hypothetical protein